MELHLDEGRGRVNLLAGEMALTLNDGYTAIFGPEERRVYDRIINSNVGVVSTIGLEGGYWISTKACLLMLIDDWA